MELWKVVRVSLFMKSTENSGLNFEQISVLKSVSGLKFVCEIGAREHAQSLLHV